MVKHVTGEELETLISTTDKTVFCDFWATWCMPCRMLAPTYEDLSDKYEGKAEFVKLDVDENEETAVKYKINSIPNITAFKGGKVIDTQIGFLPEEMFEEFLKKNL